MSSVQAYRVLAQKVREKQSLGISFFLLVSVHYEALTGSNVRQV